ncbi:MAG: metallophosphoesterase [Lutibacter sp.]|nr:metallophosphoesterase [Lutibacter sp.]
MLAILGLLKHKSFIILYIPVLFFFSCASLENQYGAETKTDESADFISENTIERKIFLIGDAGYAHDKSTSNLLIEAQKKVALHPEISDVIFLGDNIYPKGMPEIGHPLREQSEIGLLNQLKVGESLDGKTIFIPGNHDWYRGLDGLKRQADFVEEKLSDNKSFFPGKQCGIDAVELTSDITVIVVDSEWFLQNWNKIPNINKGCNIKSREQFFEEFKSLVNKNQNKLTLIAIHHPLFTNGPHGGYLSAKHQLYPVKKIPLPVLGSFINLLRIKSGASPADLHYKLYQELRNRIGTILKDYSNTIVVSGHEHNLQWIYTEGIQQIISGSGSKSEPAKAVQPKSFTTGQRGFAVLDVYKNKQVTVNYYGEKNNFGDPVFSQILFDSTKKDTIVYPKNFSPVTEASVYSIADTKKSSVYKWLWGQHYRDYYGTKIKVPTLLLDTVYGGLTSKISGGGTQSMSLRMENPEGKEYVLRAIKKDATRFLQSTLFQDQYVKNDFEETYAKDFIADFYTTAHPFTPFILETFTKKLNIFHTQPQLFYVPKQPALKQYNKNYGDALYMLEERPSKEHKYAENFGVPDDIVGTDELFENLRKDEKHQIDEKAFLKARLFDILIGDWDRHADQWRWAVFKNKHQVIYKPIPRDRDQAFAKIDGALLSLINKLPPLRHMQNFDEKMAHPRWINKTAFVLDVLFLKNTTLTDWQQTASEINEIMSDELVDEAFSKLPIEIQDQTTDKIKNILKKRSAQLRDYAKTYFEELQKVAIITGTDKKDDFEINIENELVLIRHLRKKKEETELVFEKKFTSDATKEIWIYGLDDQDNFVVKGDKSNKIRIRLIGGHGEDNYTTNQGNKIKIYDFKTDHDIVKYDGEKPSLKMSNQYELNTFNTKKAPLSTLSTLPNIGYNPDDGIKLGVKSTLTKYHFVQKPFSVRHSLGANYYFAKQGFELMYDVVVPLDIYNANLEFNARITSPNFAVNYFGYGNETKNYDQELGMNYNRVRMHIYEFTPSIFWQGKNGSLFKIMPSFESIEVEESEGRFINEPAAVNQDVFNHQRFVGIQTAYTFKNYDSDVNPTNGMRFSLSLGWKSNINEADNNFFYGESSINFIQKLNTSGTLIFATLLKGKIISNNRFEFFQGAVLGGDYDLRGFRSERFLGRSSFFNSNDLRWQLGTLNRGLVPMKYGILGGFDYGRVWLDSEKSNEWHPSAGGGLWISTLDIVTARLTSFNSPDGWRVAFGFGFSF